MSNQPSTQPDLDDQSSVLSDASAANRENHMLTQAAEPISLWVILGSAIVILIAGGVMLNGANLFNYDHLVVEGYVRAPSPDGAQSGPKPKPAIDAYKKVGSKFFVACSACHGPDGAGTDLIPPLANSEWVNGPSLRPAMIVLNGCEGPITVAGKTYNGVMTAQGAGMGSRELAGVLNYIRNSFGNKSEKLITMEMAQDALDTSKARGSTQPMTATELDADYKRDLKGEELAMDTLVDPKTLKPVSE